MRQLSIPQLAHQVNQIFRRWQRTYDLFSSRTLFVTVDTAGALYKSLDDAGRRLLTVTDEQVAAVKRMKADGGKVAAIARTVGLSL
jgi:hypothetical protein